MNVCSTILPFLALGYAITAGCAHPAGAADAGSGMKNKPGFGKQSEQGEPMDPYEKLRLEMVATQIEARGVKDERVLEAMRKVPRHLFVPAAYQDQAYDDHPLPIGYKQTISQPYIVAIMSEALKLQGEEKVLEIGTGSGYQAAVLSHLAAKVHTIEIVEDLATRSKDLLGQLGYENVTVHAGDGFGGLPEEQPFDAIMITAAPTKVPQPLKEQLAMDGKLVLPVGQSFQSLVRITRTGESEWITEEILPAVVFVPMTGKIQES